MNKGFNTAAKASDNVTVDISTLRRQVLDRLETAQQRQDPKGTFNRQAVRSQSEDAMVGSLLFGMLTWGAFFGAFGGVCHNMFGSAFDMAQTPMVAAVIDGVGFVADEQVRRQRARIINSLYPQGRRQDPFSNVSTSKKFNLVSANQNNCFTYDAQAEIACLSEMLDMLDKLDKNGVRLMQVDSKAVVYDSLLAMDAGLNKVGAGVRFAQPVRKAA